MRFCLFLFSSCALSNSKRRMNHKNTASVAVKITLVAGALLKVQTKKVSCNLERERDRHAEKELISNLRRSTAILGREGSYFADSAKQKMGFSEGPEK